MTFPHDPAPANDPVRSPTRRWIKVLLFVSLAVNVAVAGLALGAVLRQDEARDHRATRMDRMGAPYTFALSRDDRRAIWQEMRAMRDDGQPDRQQIHAEYDAVVEALRSEPFDFALLQDIVTRQFEAGIARQQTANALLLARIETMDAAERAAYADRLSEALEQWRAARAKRGPKDQTEGSESSN